MTRPVLIVDDDDELRDLLTAILESEGFEVEGAANGEEALERLASRSPGVILLDMRMPVMDGWQFAREIALRGWSRPPVVVVTASLDPAGSAAEIDADAWLGKPFDRDALLAVVRRFVLDGG